MSEKKKLQTQQPKETQLTRKERKAINQARERAQQQSRKKSISAQRTIPYERIWQDGTMQLADGIYSRTIKFSDITYQLAKPDDQDIIFGGWCSFLNYFDSSIHLQLTFFNRKTSKKEFVNSYSIPIHPEQEELCREYSDFIAGQMAKGDNGLDKTKYLTFSIEEDNIKKARIRLDRIELDILNNFKLLGVAADVLDGTERLELLFRMLHVGDPQQFVFNWRLLPESGLSTKDFICPSSFEFAGRHLRIGQAYAAASYVQLIAPEMSDRFLSEVLNMSNSQILSMHIDRVEQTKALKAVGRQLSDIEQMKIDEQKKAVRAGYDMDILPPKLTSYSEEARKLLSDLRDRNEGMFYVTFLVLTYAGSKERLETNLAQLTSLVQQRNCILTRLDFQQEEALAASLPLGINPVPVQRTLTTTSTAVFVPFTTQELQQHDDGALYYGLNALSRNVIFADRKQLKNPNGLIFGTPGSGKSFATKREIFNVYFVTNDEIRITDPEGEYYPVVSAIGGQVIRISPSSSQYINPLDLSEEYGAGESPLSVKADFILSFCETIIGGRSGLTPIEKSVIDKAVRKIYAQYFAYHDPNDIPILENLYNELQHMGDSTPEAKHIAEALDLYVHGSLNVFNHRTNVDLNNRVVCFDIKELGNQLKPLGMLVVQDQIWNAVSKNRDLKRRTRYYCDEFHLLLRDPQTAAAQVEFWKRFRKWGGIPTGITQNVKDLLASPQISNIIDNSDFFLLLNQSGDDRNILADYLSISPEQLSYIKNAAPGEGLIFYGDAIIPFVDKFPKNTKLYELMNTKPEEAKEA